MSVMEAAQLMAAKRSDCVLVVDDEEHLSGIFTVWKGIGGDKESSAYCSIGQRSRLSSSCFTYGCKVEENILSITLHMLTSFLLQSNNSERYHDT